MTLEANYTVLLSVDYDESVLRRYNELFKTSQIKGGSTKSFNNLYISERNLTINDDLEIHYDLVLALGAEDAVDITKRICQEGGQIAVAFFDLPIKAPDLIPLVGSIKGLFPSMVCAVATEEELRFRGTSSQSLFLSPSEWLYYQSSNNPEQMEQLIAHLISSFVLHQEKEYALAKNEASRKGLQQILAASPNLLQNQTEAQLVTKILETLTLLTEAENAFLVTFTEDESFYFAGGMGSYKTKTTFVDEVFDQKVEFFRAVVSDNTIVRLPEATVVPLSFRDKQIGLLFFDRGQHTSTSQLSEVMTYQGKESELLNVFAHHVAFAIENHHLQKEVEKKQALEHELNLASRIQDSLIPKEFPKIDDIELYGIMQSAKEIGGDYFDVITNGDNLYICIGDVSGKGVPAGLIMSELRSIVRAFSMSYTSPKEILIHSAQLLLKDIAGSGKFVSMLLFKWDGTDLLYSSAGHEHILHYKAETGECEAYRSGGVVLGVDFRNFSRLTKEKKLELQPNDVIVLFTDGASEAFNPQEEMFKLELLQKTVEKYSHLAPKEMVDAILSDILDFMDGAEQRDDITLLALRYKPSQNSLD